MDYIDNLEEYLQSFEDWEPTYHKLKQLSIVDVANELLADFHDGHGPLIKGKKSPNYRRLCPFHEETKPSFWVWPTSNKFYCHGCMVTGGPVMLTIELLGWEKAFEYLSKKIGIEMEELEKSKQFLDWMFGHGEEMY